MRRRRLPAVRSISGKWVPLPNCLAHLKLKGAALVAIGKLRGTLQNFDLPERAEADLRLALEALRQAAEGEP